MKKKILISGLIISTILLAIIAYNFFDDINNFRSHKIYIKQPIENQEIMDWMTLKYLNKTFSINVQQIFGSKINLLEKGSTLKEFCEEKKVNCDDFILLLEEKRNGN